jgi:hypothetical protein
MTFVMGEAHATETCILLNTGARAVYLLSVARFHRDDWAGLLNAL